MCDDPSDIRQPEVTSGTSAGAERMNSDPKFAQSADVVVDQAVLLLAGQGRGLAVAVWLSGAEDLVNQLQDGVSHS